MGVFRWSTDSKLRVDEIARGRPSSLLTTQLFGGGWVLYLLTAITVMIKSVVRNSAGYYAKDWSRGEEGPRVFQPFIRSVA